jgi:hypothetical protein
MSEQNSRILMPAIFLVPAAMSLIGLAHMPYGYYQLLRLVVTGSAALIAWQGFERGDRAMPVLFTLTALLFNPLFRVHFERQQWAILNVMVAVLYIAAFVRSRRNDQRL